jgi:pimeloyl-ACP methyl ester carboxylesterase
MSLALPLSVLIGAAALYLGRLYFTQDALVFRPWKTRARSPSEYAIPFEDLRLPLEDGHAVRAWWVPSPRSDRAVLFFHGSDGNITHELPALQFLLSLPVSALLVEYPGYEMNGVRPTERGCYQAAEAAWRFLRQQKGFEPEKIVLYGHSLGGAVATYLAAGHPCGGLVSQSGFTSVPDMAARLYPYLPVRLFCRTRMDSLQRIAQCACPFLVIHSQEDEHIPIQQAQRLFQRAPGPKKFVALHGPHFGSYWQRDPEVRAAWRELINRDIAAWK